MYGKIFTSLWQGTLYGRSQEQLVFVYLISHADSEGFVDISPKVISDATGLPEGDVVRALAFLEGPDFKSRSQEQQGARLERIDSHRDWGWRIVNYEKYRTMVDTDTRKAQNRAAQRKRRQHLSAPVSNGQHPSAQEEVEVDAEEGKSTHLSPSGDVPMLFPISKPKKPKSNKVYGGPWRVAFFEQFWPEWLKLGRECSRAAALSAWEKIPHPELENDFNRLMDEFERTVALWKSEGRRVDKYQHAATWLNDYHRNLVLEDPS